MKSYQLGPKITIVAGEALTKRRFVDNAGKHTVDLAAIGVTIFDVDSGDPGLIQGGGIAVVEAAGAITVGTHTFVTSDASGKAVGTTTFDGKVCGIPIDSSTADGDFIRVKLLT